MSKSARVVKSTLAAAVLVGVCLALAAAAPASNQGQAAKTLHLSFVKTANPFHEGVWQGTVSGDINGRLTTKLLAASGGGPVLDVRFDWIISAGAKSLTARMDGTLNLETGEVAMSGSVIQGYLLGARTSERGQLVDPKTSTFAGSILITPAAGSHGVTEES